MKKAILFFAFLSISSAAVFAQAVSDYKKAEFYIGYSNGQVDTGIDSGSSVSNFFNDRESFNGFNASGVYNISRYLGIKGDVSGTYKGNTFSETLIASPNPPTTISFKANRSLYNFVGGIQVKDNSSDTRFKPFAHAMIGAGHARVKIKDFVCSGVCTTVLPPDESFSDTGLAGVIGGGLDIKLNNKIQIRAIQLDYNPVRVFGATDHNLRIGAGVVF
jgi:opacity protein-like surface antigen